MSAGGVAALLRGLVAAKHELGFRCAYWVARAPGVENRIALAGMALEEEGHARVLETFLADELGEPPVDRDALVTWDRWPGLSDSSPQRQETWPEGLTSYYAQDVATTAILQALRHCTQARLAERAAKMVQEERFHHLFATETLRALANTSPAAAEYVRSRMVGLRPAAVPLGDLIADGVLTVEAEAAYIRHLDSYEIEPRQAVA